MSNVGWDKDKRRDNHGQFQKSKIPNWELPNIMALYDKGQTYAQIALMYDVSHVTVSRKVKKAQKWIEDGTYDQRTQQPQSYHNLR